MRRGLMWMVVLVMSGCMPEAPEWRFGFNLTGVEYVEFHDDEGVHPSTRVLENPRNPFVNLYVSQDTLFKLFDGGGNAGAFYAWATALARVPTGEHQYYTARKLADIHGAQELTGVAQERLRKRAIRAYQSVLDNFPDSVSYDITGKIPFRLATLAYNGIIGLGGRVHGGWVLVETKDGPQAVQGGDSMKLPVIEEDEE